MNREKLIEKYIIVEKKLSALLNDLLQKSESQKNCQLILNALTGLYSDFGSSSATPCMLLDSHLRAAGYDDLSRNACQGKYDHKFGCQLKGATGESFFSSPKNPAEEDSTKKATPSC